MKYKLTSTESDTVKYAISSINCLQGLDLGWFYYYVKCMMFNGDGEFIGIDCTFRNSLDSYDEYCFNYYEEHHKPVDALTEEQLQEDIKQIIESTEDFYEKLRFFEEELLTFRQYDVLLHYNEIKK